MYDQGRRTGALAGPTLRQALLVSITSASFWAALGCQIFRHGRPRPCPPPVMTDHAVFNFAILGTPSKASGNLSSASMPRFKANENYPYFGFWYFLGLDSPCCTRSVVQGLAREWVEIALVPYAYKVFQNLLMRLSNAFPFVAVAANSFHRAGPA